MPPPMLDEMLGLRLDYTHFPLNTFGILSITSWDNALPLIIFDLIKSFHKHGVDKIQCMWCIIILFYQHHFIWQFHEIWEATSLIVWSFSIMQSRCINPYLGSLLYLLWHDIISSLLLQTHFVSLMEQILVKFSHQVDNKRVKA